MGRAVEITRRDLLASDLRAAAVRSEDGRVACRLLAIARLLEGTSRREAAESCGMERQTLRDWVHRYNDQGIGGLSDCPRSGRPPALSAAQQAELKELVIAGPDPQRDGVVRWRCLDLRAVIAERYAVTMHERTVGKWLRRLDLTRLQPRPYHPKQDAVAQEAFKKLRCFGSAGAATDGGRQADRGLVPRRSPRRPEGLDHLRLGPDRLAPADGSR
jgi:transposase